MNHNFTKAKYIPTVISLIVTVTFILLTSGYAFAQLPSGFSKNTVQDNYTSPVGIRFTDDGNQFFVWEKSGRLYVSTWNGSGYVRQSTPVLDIHEEVGEWNDFGMLGFCLDPNYKTNGLIYVFYQVDLHHLLYFGTPEYDPATNWYNNATISRLTRYKLQQAGNELTTDYGSRHILIGETKETGVPVTMETHGGGRMIFGTDGTLLIGTGDGAHHEGVDVGSRADSHFQASLDYGMMRPNENVGAMRSQMVNSLCGKILRIDPNTGDGIPGNPFFDPANPRRPQSRVWALGMRMPFQLTLKPGTGSTSLADNNPGTLLVGDVGWYKVEDIHLIDKPGLNAGWPLYEGLEPTISYYGTNVANADEPGTPTFESLCVQPTSFVANPDSTLRRFTHSRPILDYSHGTALTRVPAFSGTTPITRSIGTTGAPAGTPFKGNCVVGGFYYTGNQFPATYKNSYFFSDHGENWIKNLVLNNEGERVVREVRDFAPAGYDIGMIDLQMNPRDGSLYHVQVQGAVNRISYGINQPPVATVGTDQTYGPSPLEVQFTGSASVDPEGGALTYAWDFGDGTTSVEANPTHTFSNTGVGQYTVTLVVKDNQNQTSLPKTVVISTNNTPPAVAITNPAPGTKYTMSQATAYTLAAAVTDTDTTGLTYAWYVSLEHNNHTHPEPALPGASPTIMVSPVGCSPNETYYYKVRLVVTDNGGLTASTTQLLYPDCSSASSLVSNVTATHQLSAVQVGWINPNIAFDEILVAARENTGFTTEPAGTTYAANANFNGNGTVFEGGKVVYRGNGTALMVTGLNPLVQYYFRVYTRVGSVWNGGVEVGAIPNLPPVAPPVNPPAAALNQAFSYTVPEFYDPEGQVLTYTAMPLPSWLTFNATTRLLSGTPTQTGSYTITIGATDVGSLPASASIVVTVAPNQPPVPPVLTEQVIERNQPFSYVLPAFTDPEGKTLSYSSVQLPAWLGFNPGSRVLSGTPTQTGSYSAIIRATDPQNATATATLPIRVVVNQPPVPPVLTAQTAPVGQLFQYTVPAFTDPEGEYLSYSAANLPNWLVFDPATRLLSGTPTQAGSFTVLIKATDPGNLTAVATLVINTGSCVMATVKPGDWTDPAVWSCGRIPTPADAVQLNHAVTVPGNYTAQALRVTFDSGIVLTVGPNTVLQFSQ